MDKQRVSGQSGFAGSHDECKKRMHKIFRGLGSPHLFFPSSLGVFTTRVNILFTTRDIKFNDHVVNLDSTFQQQLHSLARGGKWLFVPCRDERREIKLEKLQANN